MLNQVYFFSRIILLFGVFLVPSPDALSQNALPPLIDREVFFDNPEIVGAQISPDGKFIAFRKPYKGVLNIWVKPLAEAFDKARPLTNQTNQPISGFFWSRDGKFILFLNDTGGDENYNIFALNPAEIPVSGTEAPAARNLTKTKGVAASIYEFPRTEPDAIYVGLNNRDPKWHDLYKIRISTGERTLLRQNTERFDRLAV